MGPSTGAWDQQPNSKRIMIFPPPAQWKSMRYSPVHRTSAGKNSCRSPVGEQNQEWIDEHVAILCLEDNISNYFAPLSFSQVFPLPTPPCSLSLDNEVTIKMSYVGLSTHSHLFSAHWPVVSIFIHCCPLQKKAVCPSVREAHIYVHELKCWEVNLTLCSFGKIQVSMTSLTLEFWPDLEY